MEPRRRRRGNLGLSYRKVAGLLLQWSHGVAAVETATEEAAAVVQAQTLQFNLDFAGVLKVDAHRHDASGNEKASGQRSER
jgi:hypothetical protein